MNIMTAKHFGYCFGVTNSLEKVSDVLIDTVNVYSIGDVIHNNSVMRELKAKGLKVVESIDDIPGGATLIVRAHGLPKQDLDAAAKKGIRIVDTTCTLVKEVIKKGIKLQEQAYPLILVGKPSHPEVKAEMSYFDNAFVVQNDDDIEALPKSITFGVLAQTTESFEEFKRIVSLLLDRVKTLHIENTICFASVLRQKAAAELAKQVDVMYVIGSPTSSNTTWLYNICKNYTKTYFIEDESAILPAQIAGADSVGVTSGASAPEHIMRHVISKLEELNV